MFHLSRPYEHYPLPGGSYLALRPPTPGPLFVFQNGVPLTRVTFVNQLRDALREAGIDSSRYAGHSFRIGAATAAAHAGYSDSFHSDPGQMEVGCLHFI